MTTAKDICDQIGRQRLATFFDVGVTAVSNAVASNKFSASWFDGLEQLCLEKGIACPRELFNFRVNGDPKKVDEPQSPMQPDKIPPEPVREAS